jgi:hypothetical protein
VVEKIRERLALNKKGRRVFIWRGSFSRSPSIRPEDDIAKLKEYKSPASDQILEEMIQAGGETLLSVIHKLPNSSWNEQGLPDQWKDSLIVPIHKKGDKTDYNNYLLSTSYTILSNILSRLIPYMDKIIEDR